MIARDILANWLRTVLNQTDGRYWYRLATEDIERRPLVLEQLRQYADAAHEDALRRYERIIRLNLDPVQSPAETAGHLYPYQLHPTTKVSYLGEILAGLVIEGFGAIGLEGWRVPVWLFRFDDAAIQQLENLRVCGILPEHLPGHHGPDVVALLCAAEGRVTHGLLCEAKCYETFDADAATRAHHQLSRRLPLAAHLWRIAHVLDENPEVREQWEPSLAQLSLERDSYEECDMLCYTCGRGPLQPGRQTWIAVDRVAPEYTVQRKLQVAEIHLHGADTLAGDVYHVAEDTDGTR